MCSDWLLSDKSVGIESGKDFYHLIADNGKGKLVTYFFDAVCSFT